MRLSLAYIALFAGLLALAAGQAFAAHSSLKTVTVAMHDPGCHWFASNGKFVKTLAVSGPVALLNQDEATLKIAGAAGVTRDPVGHKVTLQKGTYKITMVGQAPDDNTLRLTVR